MDIKQVIVIRKDLNMRKGKIIAQGSHASMGCILNFGKIDNNRIRCTYTRMDRRITEKDKCVCRK